MQKYKPTRMKRTAKKTTVDKNVNKCLPYASFRVMITVSAQHKRLDSRPPVEATQ